MDSSECQSKFHLEEFSRTFKSQLVFFQLLHMQGSVYVWVGTNSGEQGSIVAAIATRADIGNINTATTLLGGNTEQMSINCASRLQAKLHYPIILSLNIPDDLQLLENVERTILEKLS